MVQQAIKHIIKNARMSYCNIDELYKDIDKIIQIKEYKEQLIACKSTFIKYKDLYYNNKRYCDLLHLFKKYV